MHKLLTGRAINLVSLTDETRALLVSALSSSEKKIWLTREAKGARVDFGTVFIVPDEMPDVFVADILDMEEDGVPIFVAPVSWRMPQILKALGAFESSSQAAKNGWNTDVPCGFEQHTVRISNTKGSLVTFKLALAGMKPIVDDWSAE